MSFEKGHKRVGGRKAGTPNHAIADVRAAIAALLSDTAPEYKKWLQQVADGIPKKVTQVKHRDKTVTTNVEWLVPPNPYRALDLISNLAEYHIPKLSRVELDNPDGKTLSVSITRYTDQPAATPQPVGTALIPAPGLASP